MFVEATRIQGRVLLALMLREARTRYGKRQLGYVWALFEPLLHIVGLTLLFSFLGRVPALGDSLPVFLATGMAPYFGFRNVLNRTKRVFAATEGLLGYPLVTLPDIFISRALLELATWILVTIILLGGLFLLGYGTLPRHFLPMLLAILSLFCIGFGGGLVVGLLSYFVPTLGVFLRLPLRFLYLASGIFYLPENMYPVFREIIAWNPVLHGVTLFRIGYFEYYDSFVFDPSYLMTWAIGSVLLGLLVTRVARKPLRKLQ